MTNQGVKALGLFFMSRSGVPARRGLGDLYWGTRTHTQTPKVHFNFGSTADGGRDSWIRGHMSMMDYKKYMALANMVSLNSGSWCRFFGISSTGTRGSNLITNLTCAISVACDSCWAWITLQTEVRSYIFHLGLADLLSGVDVAAFGKCASVGAFQKAQKLQNNLWEAEEKNRVLWWLMNDSPDRTIDSPPNSMAFHHLQLDSTGRFTPLLLW